MCFEYLMKSFLTSEYLKWKFFMKFFCVSKENNFRIMTLFPRKEGKVM